MTANPRTQAEQLSAEIAKQADRMASCVHKLNLPTDGLSAKAIGQQITDCQSEYAEALTALNNAVMAMSKLLQESRSALRQRQAEMLQAERELEAQTKGQAAQ